MCELIGIPVVIHRNYSLKLKRYPIICNLARTVIKEQERSREPEICFDMIVRLSPFIQM